MSQIEGVPLGTKLVGIRHINLYEFAIGRGGSIFQSVPEYQHFWTGVNYPIIEPDNVYGRVDLADIAIPKGYELAGNKPEEWFREPMHDDYYVSSINLTPHRFSHFYEPFETADRRRIILRKKATKKQFVVAEVEILNGYYPLHVEAELHKVGHSIKSEMSFRIEEREVA